MWIFQLVKPIEYLFRIGGTCAHENIQSDLTKFPSKVSVFILQKQLSFNNHKKSINHGKPKMPCHKGIRWAVLPWKKSNPVASSNSKFDKNLIGILWLFLLSTIKSYQSAALIFPLYLVLKWRYEIGLLSKFSYFNGCWYCWYMALFLTIDFNYQALCSKYRFQEISSIAHKHSIEHPRETNELLGPGFWVNSWILLIWWNPASIEDWRMWISLLTIGFQQVSTYNLFTSNYRKNVNLLSTKERSPKKQNQKKNMTGFNNAIVGIYSSNFWGVNWVVPFFTHFFINKKPTQQGHLTLGFQILNIISPGVFGLTIVWESFLGQEFDTLLRLGSLFLLEKNTWNWRFSWSLRRVFLCENVGSRWWRKNIQE